MTTGRASAKEFETTGAERHVLTLRAARLPGDPGLGVMVGLHDVTELRPLLESVRAAVTQRHAVAEDCVRLDCGSGLAVRGREADVEIVLRNLVDNAVKYSLPEPGVEVSAVAANGRVTVRVADNGPGIPLAQRHAVFGRFVRLGSELERSTPGTGLGLFLVRSLVKQLRGKVSVKGRIGQRGSIFEVELPAAAQAS
jgi:signal transduction histidine kinase